MPIANINIRNTDSSLLFPILRSYSGFLSPNFFAFRYISTISMPSREAATPPVIPIVLKKISFFMKKYISKNIIKGTDSVKRAERFFLTL